MIVAPDDLLLSVTEECGDKGVEDAVRAYLYMLKYHRGIELLYETPEEVPENEMRLTKHLRAVLRNAVREIAIVAALKEEGSRRIMGGCRLIVEPDSEKGQFAILIHDEFQKQGLGEKLLDAVIGIARDKGLREIYGIVLTENDKMLRPAKRMGFRSAMLPDGITRVSLQLD